MTHDLKALSREWFQDVWNNRNEAAMDRLAWPDVVVHGASGMMRQLQAPRVQLRP
jgi:hypothetical protein